MIQSLLTLLFVAVEAVASPSSVPFYEGLGDHHRAVTTQSPIAQRYFDQGLNFLYAFNHDEAKRSFRAAAQADPNCAMAWWGIAIANGPHINNPIVKEAHDTAAREAIAKAKLCLRGKNEIERQLVAAADVRHAIPNPESRTELDVAYANAMRQIWKSHPRDADVGALFAEAMMDLRPWDLWKPNGEPQPGTLEVVKTLKDVLKVNPKHPLANHLFIHTVEASRHPEQGLQAADTLRNLQPGLGHMVHMPSHIDVRVGNWKAAVIANERAMAADKRYREQSPEQGFYRLYMAHNHHMLAFAAMMRGQSAKAIQAVDMMSAEIPRDVLGEMAPVLDGFMAMRWELRKRFGKWDEILELPELPEIFPIARTLRHMNRAIAWAVKGNLENAQLEQSLFLKARQAVPEGAFFGNNSAKDLLNVAEPLLAGEILLAEGKLAEAIRELIKSVKAEDQLRYDEPPDWIQPTRHTLGVALLRADRAKEAEWVYREDLKRWPHNGWALQGLANALRAQGREADALRVSRKFELAWQDADIKIHSSCLCLPNN